MPGNKYSRLKELNDLVDQQRVSGEHRPRDPDVERKRRQREKPRHTISQPFLSLGAGPQPVVGLAPEQQDGDDRYTKADAGPVSPLDEPMRIRTIGLPARKPVCDREEPENRESFNRDQLRDRSISSTRFCRSAGLTPGILAAWASDCGRRAASFCRDSVERGQHSLVRRIQRERGSSPSRCSVRGFAFLLEVAGILEFELHRCHGLARQIDSDTGGREQRAQRNTLPLGELGEPRALRDG